MNGCIDTQLAAVPTGGTHAKHNRSSANNCPFPYSSSSSSISSSSSAFSSSSASSSSATDSPPALWVPSPSSCPALAPLSSEPGDPLAASSPPEPEAAGEGLEGVEWAGLSGGDAAGESSRGGRCAFNSN